MTGFSKHNVQNNTSSKLKQRELFAQAHKFHIQGLFQEAERIYLSLLKKGFEVTNVYVNYGVLLQQTGRIEKAIDCFLKAINYSPECFEAYLNLGNCQKILEQYEEAHSSTLKSIELNPKSPQAFINLGAILLQLGDLEQAEDSTRQAINFNSDIPEAHTNLASILLELGNLDDAKASIQRSLQLNPSSSKSLYVFGSIMFSMEHYEQAEIATSKAIKLNPKYFQAINQLGGIYKELGNLRKAEICIRKAIDLNSNYAIAHNNLASILIDKGSLKEAELSLLRAIELLPYYPNSHHNLARIYIETGDFLAAEKLLLKSIELNKDLCNSYYSLSILNSSLITDDIYDYLFSQKIINQKKDKHKIDIFFSRSNVLHKRNEYSKSADYLTLANNLKYRLYATDFSSIYEKTESLFNESINFKAIKIQPTQDVRSIFIVGMPRSGSTLLESIISLNDDVYDLGETDLFDKSYQSWQKLRSQNSKVKLEDIYLDKKANIIGFNKITTDKNLYNYQYAGLIASQLNGSKLIHCIRNPLDNILSIFRSHFAKGNRYSSSLVDCANLYLQQDHVMSIYKAMYPSKIYIFNYDDLVNNPQKEITSLITWLQWDWNDKYLSPHLNKRTVKTASSIQVRSPINKKSVNGWINYKKMLLPAIEIITSKDKFNDLAHPTTSSKA